MSFTEEQRRLLLDNAYRDSKLPELLERMLVEGPGKYPIEPGYYEEEGLPLWERVWNLVYHQGTLYPATFIAVPSMCRALRPGDDNSYPLSFLAEIEAMRCVEPDLRASFPTVPEEAWDRYAEAIRSLFPLIAESLKVEGKEADGREGLDASLLALIAFASGKERLGFCLARWSPSVLVDGREVPLSSLEQYDAWTG